MTQIISARLCHTGAQGTCFGKPFWCRLFGCAVNNPRPKRKDEPVRKREEVQS